MVGHASGPTVHKPKKGRVMKESHPTAEADLQSGSLHQLQPSKRPKHEWQDKPRTFTSIHSELAHRVEACWEQSLGVSVCNQLGEQLHCALRDAPIEDTRRSLAGEKQRVLTRALALREVLCQQDHSIASLIARTQQQREARLGEQTEAEQMQMHAGCRVVTMQRSSNEADPDAMPDQCILSVCLLLAALYEQTPYGEGTEVRRAVFADYTALKRDFRQDELVVLHGKSGKVEDLFSTIKDLDRSGGLQNVVGIQFDDWHVSRRVDPFILSDKLEAQVLALTSDGPIGKFKCKLRTLMTLCLLHQRLLKELFANAFVDAVVPSKGMEPMTSTDALDFVDFTEAMARNMPLKLVDNTDLFFAWIYSPEVHATPEVWEQVFGAGANRLPTLFDGVQTPDDAVRTTMSTEGGDDFALDLDTAITHDYLTEGSSMAAVGFPWADDLIGAYLRRVKDERDGLVPPPKPLPVSAKKAGKPEKKMEGTAQPASQQGSAPPSSAQQPEAVSSSHGQQEPGQQRSPKEAQMSENTSTGIRARAGCSPGSSSDPSAPQCATALGLNGTQQPVVLHPVLIKQEPHHIVLLPAQPPLVNACNGLPPPAQPYMSQQQPLCEGGLQSVLQLPLSALLQLQTDRPVEGFQDGNPMLPSAMGLLPGQSWGAQPTFLNPWPEHLTSPMGHPAAPYPSAISGPSWSSDPLLSPGQAFRPLPNPHQRIPSCASPTPVPQVPVGGLPRVPPVAAHKSGRGKRRVPAAFTNQGQAVEGSHSFEQDPPASVKRELRPKPEVAPVYERKKRIAHRIPPPVEPIPNADETGQLALPLGIFMVGIICSGAFTNTQIHVEDLLLMSININMFGSPKVWWWLPQERVQTFKESAELMTEGGRGELYTKSISPFLTDREFGTPEQVLPIERLKELGAKRTIQMPGMGIWTMPGYAFHFTVSIGLNVAESCNMFLEVLGWTFDKLWRARPLEQYPEPADDMARYMRETGVLNRLQIPDTIPRHATEVHRELAPRIKPGTVTVPFGSATPGEAPTPPRVGVAACIKSVAAEAMAKGADGAVDASMEGAATLAGVASLSPEVSSRGSESEGSQGPGQVQQGELRGQMRLHRSVYGDRVKYAAVGVSLASADRSPSCAVLATPGQQATAAVQVQEQGEVLAEGQAQQFTGEVVAGSLANGSREAEVLIPTHAVLDNMPLAATVGA